MFEGVDKNFYFLIDFDKAKAGFIKHSPSNLAILNIFILKSADYFQKKIYF